MEPLPTVLPEPLLPRLRGGPRLRWGILAPGFIGGRFASALHRHTDQRIVAVASRTLARAEEFAREHSIDRAYGGYERLLADPAVDAVYVAPPHSHHRELALLAIHAGKHVLVEKPIAATADEARELRDAATAAEVFLMEAMHTRFHPRTMITERLLADGVLGELTSAAADLGFAAPVDHTSRLYDPALAGGALLDLGVYSLWFTTFALGAPQTVTATGTLTETGVDAQSVVATLTSAGALGVASSSLRTFSQSLASVNGTRARIQWDSRHPLPGGLTLVGPDNRPLASFQDTTGIALHDGLCRQAVWMAQHVAEGRRESPMHPLAGSIAVLGIIDEARRQLGAAGPGRP